MLVILGSGLYRTLVYAATYTFVQTSWSGGADTVTTAAHPTNTNGWSKYYSASNVTAASTVSLSSVASSTTQTSDTDFNAGTYSSTAVTGSGASASVSLATTSMATFSTGASTNPTDVLFDPSTNSIWVSLETTGKALKLNPSTGATIGTYFGGTSPAALAFSSSANSIWVAAYGDGQLREIRASDGTVLHMYNTGLLSFTRIAYDPSTNSVWGVHDNYSYQIEKINGSTGAVTGTYSVGTNGTYANNVAFDSSTNSIWVPESNQSLYKVKAADGTNVGYAVTNLYAKPIAFDSSTNSVWAITNTNGSATSTIKKFKALDGSLLGTYVDTRHSGATALTFDPVTNSVWEANGSNVYKINASGTIVGTFNTGGSGPRGIAFDPVTNSVWVAYYTSNAVARVPIATYLTSGTFTSAPIDLGSTATLTTLSYTATLNGQTITVDARAGNTATPDGTWTAWQTNIASGGSISALGTNRYVQYRVNLATTDTTVTPTLNDITFNYTQYPASGTLTSSVYDTGDAHNLIARITWAESATTSANSIKFQVRSSLDNVTWSAWCGYVDCSGSTYFTDGGGNGQDLPNNHPLRVGNDDRYLQYKVFLASDGSGSPVLNSVSIKYVINAPPGFDPTYGTNGVTAAQIATSTDSNWGKVAISYSVRDIDTNTGTINPGFITPSFDYSTDNGATWLPIPSGDLRAADITNKAVDTSIYTTYSAVWTATSTVPNLSSSTVKVRVTANDNEAANNTGTAVSSTISLDTRAPTAALTLDASSGGSTGTLTLTTSDTSQSQYRICNDPTYPATDAQGNSCAWSALSGNLTGTPITWTPNKGGDGTETVYAQVRDAYGNVTPVTVVAPSAPTNFDLKDVSNTSISSYKEFLSWAPFTATSSVSFSSYKIYHSIDGSNFTLLTTITDPTLNYYTDTISTGTSSMQYYKVETTSSQGNVSPFTAVLSDVPNGQGGTDTTPPVIDPASIIIPSQNVTNASAVVTFSTDELSQGTVQFRQSGTTPWTTVSNQSYVLAHSVYIQGLSPNTTYDVQVSAKDVAGNVSTYAAGPSFTTSGGPVITNITESQITDSGATIVWNTSTSSDSYVIYSRNQNMSSPTSAGSGTQVSCTGALCEHKVTLTSLTAGITYYFYVSSTDGAGNKSTDTNGGSYYTFHTSVDTTPPVISAISEPVVSMTSAVIVWTTDEPATTQVTWGTASGQLTRSTVADLTKSVYHIVTLSSQTQDTTGGSQALTAITPYYFKAISLDAAGNTATSPEQTFTTADAGTVRVITQFALQPTGTGSPSDTTPPAISSVTVGNIGAFSADVHVTTNKDTTTFVSYGPTTDYGSIEGNDQLASTKTITLKNLQEGKTYHVRVKVVDQYGTAVAGSDQTFTTIYAAEDLANLSSLDKATQLQDKLEQLIQSSLPSLAPPFITKPVVSNITESSATVSWTTNIKSYGSLRYATDAEFTASSTGGAANSPAYKTEVSDGTAESTSHSIDLSSLQPNTLYHVQARAHVFPQVVGASDDVTFSTKAAAIVPNIVAVKNDGFTVVWQTDDPTTSTVTYQNLKTGERNVITDVSLKTYHNVQIENQPSGTTFAVSVSGTNSNDNLVSSDGLLRVTTSVDLTPPVISNFKVDNALIPGRSDLIQTVVGWQTDKPANSTVYYQDGAISSSASSTTLKNKVESLDSYTTAHIMILPSLKPGVVYSLKVVSEDLSGNTRVFGPTSIITPRATKSVLDIIVKNFEETFKFLGAGK